MSSSEQPDRRAFLKGLGTVGATGVAAMVSADAVAEPQATRPPRLPPRRNQPKPLTLTSSSPRLRRLSSKRRSIGSSPPTI